MVFGLLNLDPEKTIGWAENQYEGILGGIAGGTLTAIVYPFAKAKTRRIKAAIDAEKELSKEWEKDAKKYREELAAMKEVIATEKY